jgi:hypothetical protein
MQNKVFFSMLSMTFITGSQMGDVQMLSWEEIAGGRERKHVNLDFSFCTFGFSGGCAIDLGVVFSCRASVITRPLGAGSTWKCHSGESERDLSWQCEHLRLSIRRRRRLRTYQE